MRYLMALALCGCLLSVPLLDTSSTADAYYNIYNDTSITVDSKSTYPDISSPTMQPISVDDVFKKPDFYEESLTLRDEPYDLEPQTYITDYTVNYYSTLGYYDIIGEKHPVLVECTEEELELLVRTMYLEAGAESDECIRAVTDTTFNQLNSELFGNTLTEVLYRPSNFTETVWRAWTIEPSQRVRDIVMDVYYNGISLPERILYFRNQYYHDITWSIPEFNTDNVFFSSSIYYFPK